MTDLPPPILLIHLIETFFDTINVWFPVLHFSSITVLLEDYDRLSEEDEVLLHAITTATLRLLPKDAMTSFEQRSQREYSIRRVKLYVLSHVSIRTLQALVILSVDAFGTDRMPGLLALLGRQLDMLSAPRGYPTPVTPRSECSSPASMFDEQAIDNSMVDTESLECLAQATQLLEQFCCLITVSRAKAILGSSSVSSPASVLSPEASSSPYPTTPSMALPVPKMRSRTDRAKCEESGTMTETSNALVLLSQVFEFAQTSFQSTHAAAQPDWRRTYASLNRGISESTKTRSKLRSASSDVCGDIGNDTVTASAIYQASSIFLHSIAIQMFTDLDWNPQIVMDPWRAAITGLYKTLVKSTTLKLSPAVAFCIWMACRACVCHTRFFDQQTSSAVSFFIRILKEMGGSWSLAKAYAEQSVEFVGSIRVFEARESMAKQWNKQRRGLEQAPPASLAMDATPVGYSTPSITSSEDEATLFSCFDWTRFETEGSTASVSSPEYSSPFAI